jgi:hypothetical protein
LSGAKPSRGSVASPTFSDWVVEQGFRRVGVLSATSLHLTENVTGGCVYLWIRRGRPLNVGECGQSLRARLRNFVWWLQQAETARAEVLRAALVAPAQIWARPAGRIKVLDGSVTDRHAIEQYVIDRWRPLLNVRGVSRSGQQVVDLVSGG